ncbi:MAG TPA: right-handed parallel beta-helix repeat-containing protein, partial [Candidatus Limnocylindrales bacterium]
NGGNAGANDFGLTIGGNAATSGTAYTLDANTPYAIDEAGLAGYSFVDITGDAECPALLGGTVTLDEGTNVTCTITNDDQPASLTIVKHVINDNGGDAEAADWTMDVSAVNPSDNNFAGAESPGVTIMIDAGAYSVGESGGPSGYSLSSSAQCSGTAVVGGTYTCTLTNNDIQPTVTVTKQLSPSSDPGRFNLLIDGTTYATNVGNGGTTGPRGINAGSRTVSETGGTVPATNLANYTTAINCGAWGSGAGTSLNLTLNPGDVVECTITNTVNDADADAIPDFLDCTPTLATDRVVDPSGVLAAYLPLSRRHNTLQLAVNAAADDDLIAMYANTSENVEIGGAGVGAPAAGKDLRIVGCGKMVTALVATKPVINIFANAGANDGNTGKGEKDIHVDDLNVKGGTVGYFVQTTGPGAGNTTTLLKAIRATNSGVGVRITGNGNQLRGANQIATNSGGGVQVTGNGNVIEDNRIGPNTGHGLTVTGNANQLTKNKVESSSMRGLFVTGNLNDISENYAYLNTGGGIFVVGDTNLIKKNAVGDAGKGNKNDGINVTGSGNELTENNVFANTGVGIRITGNASLLKKNAVGDKGKGNTSHGILLTGSGSMIGRDFEENDVYANTGDGIRVIGSNNWLHKNDVGDKDKGNGGDGIHVEGSGNKLTENDSFANKGDGFDISGSTAAAPNVLFKNVAGKSGAGNLQNGFLIAGTGNGKTAPVEIEENTAKANKLNGFKVTGTAMELKRNTSGGGSSDNNGDWEFIVAAGNWNQGDNKSNGTTVAGAVGTAFPTAGQGSP